MRTRIRFFGDGEPPKDDDPFPTYINEGWYPLTIESYVEKQGSPDFGSHKFLNWCFRLNSLSEYPDYRLFSAVSFKPQAQWRLLQFIDAVTGIQLVSGIYEVDFDTFVGKQLQGNVKNHIFNRKTRSGIAEFKSLRP